MVIKSRSLSLLKHLTVEPTLFLYQISYSIVEIANQNLLLQKTCRYDTTSEPNLSTPCDDEKRGILYASEINTMFRFGVILVCIVYSIFAMIWSDESGIRRRPLIFLPAFALILQSLSGCLHSYFWHWAPINAVLSDTVLEVMTGGPIMVHTISRTYICDISSFDSRTMRMGILSSANMAANLIANSGSGFILRRLGFFYTYFLCTVLAIGSLALGLIFIKDISVPVSHKTSCWRIFHLGKIVDSFKIVFKKSLGKKRMVVFLLLMISIFMVFLTYGEKTVFYLYLRYRFHWNEEDFSSYVFYRYCIVIIGTMFCSVILSKWLKIHDGLIGAFAAICDTIAAFGYLFASENWHLYYVPIFDMFHGTAQSVCISLYTKFYESGEIGRLYAVCHVFALIAPTCGPVYNIVFQKTIDFFPSAFFIVSIALNAIVVSMYLVTYFMCRKLVNM